jgi:RNA polymerase I-specific transcription initiation factor RRN5
VSLRALWCDHVGTNYASACMICKKRKRKCDRRIPCSYCAQTNTHCVYVQNPLSVLVPDLTPSRIPLHAEGVNMQIDESRESRVLQAITEANLLDPKVMLTLSKEIFMNRSAEFPSPWMHWSQYSSELASEPSIYRSAFNDFHRLALSVTKRLTQIAIIQATSRLRAQRVRGKKGVLPLVRKRDIFTAIDVLGMRRNGNERWQGVARRCGLKVVSSRKSPKGKITREVPWSEVESIMSPVVRSETQPIRKAETDTEPDKFKSRVARTATPLPMHSLTLTDAEDDHDSENEDAERSSDDELHPLAHRNVQRGDLASTHTSVSPTTRVGKVFYQPHTVEEFDQEASRQEERALWDMLGLAAGNQIISTKPDNGAAASESEIDEIEEGIVTESEDWRQSLDYKPLWETYDDAVTSAKFFMNSKPLALMRATRATRSNSAADPFDEINYNSSTSGSTRPRRRLPVEIELQARGTNAYAALQRHEVTHAYDTNYISNAENEELEQDIPTQSIEAGHNAADFESPESDMDWV